MSHVRDVTLGQGVSRARKKAAPVVFSTLRDSVLNVLRTLGVKNRAAQPAEVLRPPGQGP